MTDKPQSLEETIDKPLSLEEDKELSAALDKASESMEQLPDDFTFVTSTGAVIEAIEPPDNIMQRVLAQFPERDPPIVTITQGSKTWKEPNANDPDYVRKRRRRMVLLGEAVLKVNMFKGMVILELPKDQSKYEDDTEWIEEYEAIGLDVPGKEQKTARYLEWLRYRILPSAMDMEGLRKAGSRLEGISEEDIEAAAAKFLPSSGRDADSGVDSGA